VCGIRTEASSKRRRGLARVGLEKLGQIFVLFFHAESQPIPEDTVMTVRQDACHNLGGNDRPSSGLRYSPLSFWRKKDRATSLPKVVRKGTETKTRRPWRELPSLPPFDSSIGVCSSRTIGETAAGRPFRNWVRFFHGVVENKGRIGFVWLVLLFFGE
jgi:hypothetical protein